MSAHFDYYHMFYHVGKYGNITQAAAAMFLSQSTVSRGMQCLENELGCVLFERTRNGIVLTEEGRALYPRVAAACESIFLGEEELARMKSRAEGSLRVGVSDLSFSQFVLPAMLQFRKTHPSVRIDIISSGFHYTDDVFRALVTGKTDLACTAAAEVNGSPDDQVRVDPVASYGDIVIADGGFSELRDGVGGVADLIGYPFAGLVLESADISEAEKLFRQHDLVLRPQVSADAVSMFVEIVRKTRCVALIPSLLRDAFTEEDGMFEVRVGEPLPRRDINLLTAANAPADPLREEFLQVLRGVIAARVGEIAPG